MFLGFTSGVCALSSMARVIHPNVLFADNHVIAVNKPNGILSQRDRTGDASMNEYVAAWLLEQRNTRFAAAVHRLDRPVSGAMLVACTRKAAGRLSRSLADGRIHKSYLVCVEGVDLLDHGWLVDALSQGARVECATLVHSPEPPADFDTLQTTANRRGAQLAVLEYTAVARYDGRTLLDVRLSRTGRRHQIRAQLAARDAPVVGDVKYGLPPHRRTRSIQPAIALHAATLRAPHPIADRPDIAVAAPIPDTWNDLVGYDVVTAARAHVRAASVEEAPPPPSSHVT